MQIEKSLLLPALISLEKVAKKTVLPITEQVLVVAEQAQSKLRVAATNLSVFVELELEAYSGEGEPQLELGLEPNDPPGGLCVSAVLLRQVVESLPERGPVWLDFDLVANTLTVWATNRCFEAQLKGVSAEDFPVLPKAKPTKPLAQLDNRELRQAIGTVCFAAAADNADRPVLAGANLQFGEGGWLELAAADGFRLAVARIACQAEPRAAGWQVVVNATSLELLAKLLPLPPLASVKSEAEATEAAVELRLSENQSQLLFQTAGFSLAAALVEAQFPRYHQMIPTSWTIRLTLRGREVQSANRLVGYFCLGGQVRACQLKVKPAGGEDQANPNGSLAPGQVTIQPARQSQEYGTCRVELDAPVEGAALMLNLASPLLADFLRLAKDDKDTVTVEFTTAQLPVVFRLSSQSQWLGVLMPVQVE